MPPRTSLGGLAQGFSQAAGGFTNALASVMDRRRQREQAERQRQQQNLLTNLKLASTPGVSLGEPPTSPMEAGPSSPAPEMGEKGQAILKAAQGFTASPGPETASQGVVPGAKPPSAQVDVMDEGSPAGTFSEGLAATVAGSRRPEVESGSATRLGEFGGEPVYFDPAQTPSAIKAEREQEAYEDRLEALTSEGMDPTRAQVLARDPSATQDVLTRQDEQMPWQREGFGSREEYLGYLREKEQATTLPDTGGGAGAPGFNPSDQQLEQVGVPEQTRQALQNSPASVRKETFNRYATGLEDPEDSSPGWSRSQAMDFVDSLYRTGFDYGADQPEYSRGPLQRAAQADSLLSGELTIDELAGRQGGGAPQDTTPDLPEPPRSKVQQVVQAAGSIEDAIGRLEGLDSRDRAQEAMLQHLRSLQQSGNTGGR